MQVKDIKHIVRKMNQVDPEKEILTITIFENCVDFIGIDGVTTRYMLDENEKNKSLDEYCKCNGDCCEM